MNKNTTAAKHRWALYADCSDAMRKAYGPVPELPFPAHARGLRVHQLHPVTGELIKVHSSIVVVCRDFQATNKGIKEASQTSKKYKNFKWKVIK